LLPVGSHLLHS